MSLEFHPCSRSLLLSEGKSRTCLLVLELNQLKLCFWPIGSSPLSHFSTRPRSGSSLTAACSPPAPSLSRPSLPSCVVRILGLFLLKAYRGLFYGAKVVHHTSPATWSFSECRDFSRFLAVRRTQVANGLSCGRGRGRESSPSARASAFPLNVKTTWIHFLKFFTLFFFLPPPLLSCKKFQDTCRMIPLPLIQKQKFLYLASVWVSIWILWLAFMPVKCVELG